MKNVRKDLVCLSFLVISSFSLCRLACGDQWVPLMHPYGIEADDFGNIYVAGKSSNYIWKFTSDGKLLTKWPGLGGPVGVSVDKDGKILVVDDKNYCIQKFDSDGRLISTSPSLRWGPHDISVSESGDSYVTDFFGTVWQFAPNGDFMKKLTLPGNTRWGNPVSIAASNSGDLFVTTLGPAQILRFSLNGNFKNGWEHRIGDTTWQIDKPMGIAVDKV